jgi:hypothetical protein
MGFGMAGRQAGRQGADPIDCAAAAAAKERAIKKVIKYIIKNTIQVAFHTSTEVLSRATSCMRGAVDDR